MTLRHYGRALAAASGAVLLCATLSVPALATPTSDTGAAAPVAASATDEGSAPITVTVARTDSHGDKVYEGDLITITVTYTNNTDSALTVFPVDSNLSGVLTTGAPNCRWHNLAAHTTKQCTTATHTVTADDVAAGTFTPMTTWAATRDRNGTDVIAGGITANADPVTVAQGERPPAPDPLETPQDYAIGDKVRLASPGLAGFTCHRIPALTTANNGWIIASWDGRPNTCQDAPQANSIVYRISKDGGKSWTPIKTALAGTPGAEKIGYSDPSFVVDRTTGTIFLFSVKSYDAGLFQSQLGTDPAARNILHAHVVESHDNGETWVNPRTITDQEVADLLKSAEQDINNEKAQKLIAEAQAAYDKGFAYMGVDASGNRLEESTSGALTNNGLITNGENLSSPMADKEEGVGEQHSPAVLLDSNAETYFHTSWHGGDDAWKGNHFLQFKLDNPESELLLKWVKRNHGNANGGAPEKITIWGAKTDAALEAGKAEKMDQDGNVVTDENGNNVVDFDAWKKNKGWDSLVVSTFTYPYTVTWQDNNGADVKKTNFAGTSYFKLPADKGAYKYFRMEVTKTVGNGEANGNKFFYGSEFRVYKGAYDGQNSLIDAVPQADRTALTTAIATLKGELNTQKATKASIEALRAAYDQFLKNYPDPSRVTKAIAAAKALEAAAEENGNEVGYYAAGSKATYKTAIETVENNLKAITATKQPTVAQVNDLLAQLDAANKAFAEKLNVPADGIYRIVSKSSEASIEGNSVVANTPSTQNYLKLDGRMKEGSTYKDVPDFETRLGAYWKLTKVAGGYTYQNLYTGLYLAPKEEKGTRVMSLRKAPYTLDLRYAKTPGCFNLVADTADVQGKEHIYVNAEPGSKNLVLWNEANGKDNSAFSFKEAKSQLEDALQAEFSLPIKKGVAQIITLPIAADPGANNFYTVIGQDANNRIQLKKHEGTLEAGQAYVLIPEAGDDESVILLSSKAQTIATLAPVSTPATPVNGLVPVFETTKVNKDSGVFNADHSKVLLSEVGESVAAGSGYFTKMPMTTETGDKYLETNGTITTVGRVVANGQLVNAVYTLSGVRVKDTKHLPAGLYIVNGKKVVVK